MKIGITMGDPKGVGPEIVVKAWKALDAAKQQQICIYGDRATLEAAAEMAGVQLDHRQIIITSSITPPVGDISDPEAARVTCAALSAAFEDIKAGNLDALVTAPVNKFRMQTELPKFVGHTEYFADGTDTKDVTMMFASDAPCMAGFSCPTQPMRIALATTHLPIKDVSKNLSTEGLVKTIKHLCCALRHLFGCKLPRIGVLALNPHAGDEGALGSEEKTIIAPAIEMMRKEGCTCIGPLVPDRVFGKINQLDFDGIVAMYHDQGLIPMKLLYGMNTVNITLGLPFARTSPAHGTAEDIAWRDMASPESMLAAIEMAERMAITAKCMKND